MAKTLLLFLFSMRVDSYVNAVAYAYDVLRVERVKLVHVRGAKTALSDREASDVSGRIWDQIRSLSEGEYIDFSARDERGKPVVPPPRRELGLSSRIDVYRRVYEQLLNRELVVVEYSDLQIGLKSIFKDCGGVQNCVVDLTTPSRVPSIDIFSMCLALGAKSVFTFELSDSPNPQRPEESLYHALTQGEYSYTRLTESPAIKASQRAILRKGHLLWYVAAAALLVMGVSLYIYFTAGAQSILLQIVNLLASIVGIVTPLFTLVGQRRRD